MNKLFILALFSFLFVIPSVSAAKIVTYVTNSSTGSTCADLAASGATSDALYCVELTDLGYDVRTINEQHVIDNSGTWSDYARQSAMIFIGSVNLRTVNLSQEYIPFCSGLYSAKSYFRYLKFFFTPPHTIYNYAGNLLQGCAFHSGFGFNWPPGGPAVNNTCSQATFKILDSGYVTEGYNIGNQVSLYTSSGHSIDIHNKNQKQWVGMECKPGSYDIDFYPSISSHTTSSDRNSSFWGMRDPQDFTSAAWNFFDRSVVYLLGDHIWNVKVAVVPAISTTNNNFWILARVTERGNVITNSNGIVNFTIPSLGVKGGMTYENGFWVNKTTKFQTNIFSTTVNVTAYSTSHALKGNSTTLAGSGDDVITIQSPDTYVPNTDYLISATFSEAILIPFYRVTKLPDLTNVSEGTTMSCTGRVCNKTVTPGEWGDSFVVEVMNIFPDFRFRGGSFKLVNKFVSAPTLSLTTDKAKYKPGAEATFTLTSDKTADETPKISIFNPSNQPVIENIEMTQVTSTKWTLDYTINPLSANGIYTARANFVREGRTFTAETIFEVVAWKLNVDTDALSYNASDDVEISVTSTEVYKSNLKIDVNVSIIFPDSSTELIDDSRLTGNDSFDTTYTLSAGAQTGKYFVKLDANDSEGRIGSIQKEFLVGTAETSLEGLVVSPATWSIVTVPGELVSKTFTLTNLETISASNILVDIEAGLEDIISVTSVSTSIAGESTGNLILRADTSGLSEGTYSGDVTITSSVGNDSILTSLTVVGDLSARADDLLDELHSLLPSITDLQSKGADVSDMIDLYNETEDLLNEAKTDYQNEDYAESLSKITDAEDNIADLRSMITGYSSGGDLGNIIWGVAGVVVIAVAGITAWKFRDRIRKILNRILKRKEEEEVEEVYTKPEGEYRTEYY